MSKRGKKRQPPWKRWPKRDPGPNPRTSETTMTKPIHDEFDNDDGPLYRKPLPNPLAAGRTLASREDEDDFGLGTSLPATGTSLAAPRPLTPVTPSGSLTRMTPHKAESRPEWFEKPQPVIHIHEDALLQMGAYIGLCSQEIGWLGVVEADRDEDIYVITKCFLFDQQVSGVTTEIDPEMLAKFAHDLIQNEPNGMETVNKLTFWGHSHVNMGVSPSGQDESQMRVFKDSGQPFMIRGIGNKRGEMKFDLFDYERGYLVRDVEWAVISDREDAMRRQIAEEMRQKVKLMGSGGYGGSGSSYGGSTGTGPARLSTAWTGGNPQPWQNWKANGPAAGKGEPSGSLFDDKDDILG